MMPNLNKSHVQSYIFSMNKTTLEYLINCEIFSITNYAKTFKDAIGSDDILGEAIGYSLDISPEADEFDDWED